ncbi:MAG: hypothetical protein Q7K42_01450 [Candidatus Diapherotrites archaeon]|nr:hypothetical protein [Candidatus Diapherotrites archaeon]
MRAEELAEKYWKDRKMVIDELQKFDLPASIIGNMKEHEQTTVLHHLKNASEPEIEIIVQALKKNFEDK